ncbi:SDR family NAD(P)-dependent oxidoreductase [Paraglaciecola marina]|uniref:SDR family NAD(P)-dependent oxidoreductase n=1 Tax=Paraglaciecola marina TaxID=2500157 RepID=UPI001061369D|nr:SDR family oxidoreductase [Paraglaciecola marina]
MNFANKTILITGASSGIGKEFATQLASKGANLIITARSEHELNVLSQQLTTRHNNIWVKVIPLDLLLPDSPKMLFTAIQDMGLSVDYLINNAGFGKFCHFEEASFDTYQNMLTLNIHALTELCYLFLPAMKQTNSGGIINIASTASFQPLPYQAVYGASKAFVLNFSEALTGELLGSQVKVMALCPGITESNFMSTANADTSTMKFAPASKVVEDGLTAFSKGKIYKVSGLANYLTSLVPRLFSRKQIVKIVANMFKDRMLD